ncbi:MAG: hypothetical protein COA79_23650 [Planctomycetota bacterium]|nr:MAG: hypothetical protein COA79_23650 [Planctomycetota bacterium]
MIIICPNNDCKVELGLKKEMFGKVIRCPNCDKTIKLKTYRRSKGSKLKTDPEIQKRKLIAFFKSILLGNFKNASALLSFSPNLANTKDAKGRFPIHLAVKNKRIEVIELLLAKGADIESQDINKKTPLHYAAEGGIMEAIELLLAKGADLKSKDKLNETAFDLASKHNHKQISFLLRSN